MGSSNGISRYFAKVEGDIPISALLYDDESIITTQDGVGLYNGKEKAPNHQNGTIHLTSHRLFYIDAAHPRLYSVSLSLSFVRLTEYYAGFLKSSAKVTMTIGSSASDENAQPVSDVPKSSWVCGVCSFSNPPSASDGRPKCTLCGAPREVRNDRSAYSASAPTLSTPPIPSAPPSASGSSSTKSISCPVCTFLNHPSMLTCEICSSPLRATPMRSGTASPAPEAEANSKSWESIKVSFRRGGDKTFYAGLKRTLMGKAWETEPRARAGNSGVSTPGRAGIHGILQNVTLTSQATDDHMEDAFRDLDALMAKAKEMVDLAETLNKKLTAYEELQKRSPELSQLAPSPESEDITLIRSSLGRLGLPTIAVTQDMVQDEREYHDQLARELATVLQDSKNGLMSKRGVIGLDEVWSGWNRARGVALIPPSSLMDAIPYLSNYTNPPVHMTTLRSGLRVLYTPHYSMPVFTTRLLALLSTNPHTTVEIARTEGMSVGLVEDMILKVEEEGKVARDGGVGDDKFGGSGGEVTWWPNYLIGYVWDGDTG
ncbi:hypothetical protein BOTBODRAFT_64433 [Botryobasidium botryosum FD-172 SS1]|uniref:Vacuolar protein-sorting-associated protein 36 n=1 Tax=Botryobasidium botryosum (strain FD-172 SS1) TaxID=930990 RepID=A0A067MZG8_BOTB1|nr:hypothetical protein BOTBODRAFT_64433 [Botryobasidium botryosum FD-172 SS1]